MAPRRLLLPVLALAASIAALSCQGEGELAALRALQVTDRSQLIGGGPRALGDVGDYLLSNDKIRVVIQKPGFSRGFGVYGGGLIDADLRRADEQGPGGLLPAGGHDTFAELFPSFFFQAVACDKVEVLSDGSRDYDQRYGGQALHYGRGAAVVRASGGGGEFLTLLRLFDSLFLSYLLPTSLQSSDGSSELIKLLTLLGDRFADFAIEIAGLKNENARFEIDYLLRPGARHVEIHARMVNATRQPLRVPSALLANRTFQAQLGGVDLSTLRVPLGTVMLYGRLNDVFMPGPGFDLRHAIDRAFARALPIPAFSGLVTEFIASASHRPSDPVSYGLIAEPSDSNFVWRNQAAYRSGGTYADPTIPIDRGALLVPFTANSFIGIFSGSLSGTIAPGEYLEAVQDFVVGSGDVASILDQVLRLRGLPSGRYQGRLRDAWSGEPVDGTRGAAQLLIYQDLELLAEAFASEDDYLDQGLRRCALRSPTRLCRPFSQARPDGGGDLTGALPPGRYAFRVQGEGRALGPFSPFEIRAGETTALDPRLPPPALVTVFAADQDGTPIPAKATLVGSYDQPLSDAVRRSGGLFDQGAGEAYRYTDMLDDAIPGQRAYIEAAAYTDQSGVATVAVRPGDYVVHFSRGFEYDQATAIVHAEAGSVARASGRLSRVVDTTGWLSLDTHVHHDDSIDSAMPVVDRLLSAAAEGVEVVVSTNHNFVSRLSPAAEWLGLSRWLTPLVGIEFTTLESGHFNSFPLAYPIEPVTHGSFDWFGRPPDYLFAGLRARAADGHGKSVIICNHPRDAILGYFTQYGRSSLTGGMLSAGPSRRLAGPSGPAFFDEHGQSTLSYGCDALEVVNGKLAHEIRSVRVPTDWPAACYQPLPPGFDPARQKDPCSLRGKVLRPASIRDALVPGTLLVDRSATAPAGDSGIDNLEAVFPGAVDDWFHMLNQGFRHTGLAASDSHGGVGEEVGSPRTWVFLGRDDPRGLDPARLVDAINRGHAATLGNGPFLTFTVAAGAGVDGGVPIGAELAVSGGAVSVNYKLAAAPWVSVSQLHVYLNGRLVRRITVDPARNLADSAAEPDGPLYGQLVLTLDRDSWIVLEAVGDRRERPMFPVVTGTEEPFLLVSDAVGALAGPLGIAATTDIGAVVVGNEPPYAITNPVWVRTGAGAWRPPGVVPYAELARPDQDPGVGVLRTRNH